MTDRERIYNLVDKVCDLSIKAIDKITELKQENSKLKQRVAELEKPKKKRKFRAMTNGERGKEMTNFEEMAKFLISFYFDVSVNSAKYTNMEKWLQSEVEE